MKLISGVTSGQKKKENITDKVLNKRKKAYFMGEKDYLIILNEIS